MKLLRRLRALFSRAWAMFRRVYRSITWFLPSRRAELKKISWIVGSLEHIVLGVFQYNFPRCLFSINDDRTITIRHESGKKYTTRSFDVAVNAMIDDGVKTGTAAMNDILKESHQQFQGLSGIPDEPIYF